MSVFTIPRPIAINSNARCGMVPNAWFHRQLVIAQDHLAIYRHREIWRKSLELGTDFAGYTALAGRHRFRTGFGVTKVDFVFLLAPTTAVSSGADVANAYYSIALTDEVAATTTTQTIAAPVNTAATLNDSPDSCVLAVASFDVDEATDYTVNVTPANAARAVSFMAYERCVPTTIDESASSVFNEDSPTGGSPIFDASRQKLLVGLSNMLRGNGGISVHWSKYDGSARTRTSAVACNLIDDASTGDPVAGTHAGWYLDPRFKRSASRTTVPFVLSVYASVAGGGGATVRLRDTGGNTRGSISFTSATPAWYSTAFDLPESAELWLSPQYLSDGVNQASVFALAIQELED